MAKPILRAKSFQNVIKRFDIYQDENVLYNDAFRFYLLENMFRNCQAGIFTILVGNQVDVSCDANEISL